MFLYICIHLVMYSFLLLWIDDVLTSILYVLMIETTHHFLLLKYRFYVLHLIEHHPTYDTNTKHIINKPCRSQNGPTNQTYTQR